MLALRHSLNALIELALEEDLASAGDITSNSTVPAEARGRARVVAKATGTIAGLEAFVAVFERVDPAVKVDPRVAEGDEVKPGDVVIALEGNARSLLVGERPALNFLQRLSGTATLTRELVEVVKDTPGLRICDTRKTTPGWRALQKAAVRTGGGHNHRAGLYDAVLIKENHIAAAGGITAAVTRARELNHHLVGVEVEVTNFEELEEALSAGVDTVMLDNFDDDGTRAAVARIRAFTKDTGRRVLIEASGNMSKARLPAMAAAGVDVVSVGALTHSAPALDLSMKLELMG